MNLDYMVRFLPVPRRTLLWNIQDTFRTAYMSLWRFQILWCLSGTNLPVTTFLVCKFWNRILYKMHPVVEISSFHLIAPPGMSIFCALNNSVCHGVLVCYCIQLHPVDSMKLLPNTCMCMFWIYTKFKVTCIGPHTFRLHISVYYI